jgi:hypothetical protein
MSYSLLYGIFFQCPHKERDPDCVIAEILNLNFKERIDWFENFNENQKQDVFNQHLKCSLRKG